MKRARMWLLLIVAAWLAISIGLVNRVVGGLISGVTQAADQIAAFLEIALTVLAVPVLLFGIAVTVLWRSRRSAGIELVIGAMILLAGARLARAGMLLLDGALHRMADELLRSAPR